MTTQSTPASRIPAKMTLATEPGLADTPAGEVVRAADASAMARTSLTSEKKELDAARKVAATGSYRQLDQNGNSIDREVEQLRVASRILALERTVAAAQLELDSAEAFEESLDNAQF